MNIVTRHTHTHRGTHTDRKEENYIPSWHTWHTLYAGGIKTVGGVDYTNSIP